MKDRPAADDAGRLVRFRRRRRRALPRVAADPPERQDKGGRRRMRVGRSRATTSGRRLRPGRISLAPDVIVRLAAGIAILLGAGLVSGWGEELPSVEVAESVAWLVVDLAALGWLWFHRQKLREAATSVPVALLLVVNLALVASVAWSFDPLASAREAALITATTAVGLMIGLGLRASTLIDVLIGTYALWLATSALATVVLPELAYVTYPVYPEGSYQGWVGLQGNKNLAGSTAAIACLVFVVGLLRGRIRPWLGLILLIAALAALIGTWSVTALISGGVGLTMLLVFYLAHRAGLPSVVVFITGLITLGVATYLGILFADEVTRTLGKAPSLTGRTDIWSETLNMTLRAPWSGYGAGVVFGLGDLSWLPEYQSTLELDHAHNGLLDLASQIGLPLATLAVVQVALTAWAAVVALARQKSSLTYFALAYVFLFVGHNIAESGLFRPNYEEWLIYVALSARLALIGREAGAGRRAGSRR